MAKAPKQPLDTSSKKDNLARRHLNQLSGESARGTKVDMKKKFSVLKGNKAVPRRMKGY